jgi:hypothetical protein
MKRTILLALFLACGAAQASEWVSLDKSSDGKIQIFVDSASIKVLGEVRHVWSKIVFEPHTQKGIGPDQKKWVSYTLTRFAFFCADGTDMMEGVITHYEDGSSFTFPDDALSSSWQPVEPDTRFQTIMDFTCSWKPK